DFDIPTWAQGRSDVVILEDQDPAHIRWLMTHCYSYLSFSRQESFGWSLADALHDAPSIVSRRIGVLSYKEADVGGVSFIDEGKWFCDFDKVKQVDPSARDLDW